MKKFKKIYSKNYILDNFKLADVNLKYFNWFKNKEIKKYN